MKRITYYIVWSFIALLGLYLVLLEVGMAISESHAFHGLNIVIWAGFSLLGIAMFLLGLIRIYKLTRKNIP